MSDNNVVRITEETITKTFAELIVNGKSEGKREINGGPSLKEFATAIAREKGIRTFTVMLDGAPVTSANADAPVPSGATVAVNAKDSRGSVSTDGPEEGGEEQGGEAEEGGEQPAAD